MYTPERVVNAIASKARTPSNASTTRSATAGLRFATVLLGVAFHPRNSRSRASPSDDGTAPPSFSRAPPKTGLERRLVHRSLFRLARSLTSDPGGTLKGHGGARCPFPLLLKLRNRCLRDNISQTDIFNISSTMGLTKRVCATFLSTLLRITQLVLALYVVGVAGYHIRRVVNRDLSPSGELYAIIVIASVAALFALIALITAFFWPGPLFALAAICDLIFMGGFIAIAVLLRSAATAKCSNFKTGDGASTLWASNGANSYSNDPEKDCNVDKTAFAVSVATAVLFVLTALLSYGYYRSHRKNRAFGPGPRNGYSFRNNTAPSKRRSWGHRHSEEAAITETSTTGGNTAVGGSQGAYETTTYEPNTFTRNGTYREATPKASEMPAEAGGYGTSSGAFATENGAGGFDPRLKEQSLADGYRF